MKNRVDTEGINVVYCPTEEMLADFYTKPLHGALFRLSRDVIRGLRHIDDLKIPLNLANQERVGNNVTLGLNKPKVVSRINESQEVSRNGESQSDLPNIMADSKTVRSNMKGQQGGKTDDAPVCNTLRIKTYADVVRNKKMVRIRSPDDNLFLNR